MSRILVPSLEISESTLVARERELPLAGDILVKLGDIVTADTIVAQAALPGPLYIEKLAEKLGFEPSEILEGLKVKEGDKINKGDLLFYRRGFFGLFNSSMHSRLDGDVELVSQAGHVSIRLPSKPISLNAYISGKVTEINDKHSVTITTEASLIQGIFGVGGERTGKIRFIENLDEINSEQNFQDTIVCCDVVPDYELIKTLAEKNAVAFVFSSIKDEALKAYLGFDLGVALTGDENVPMTLVITEGFGDLKMSQKAKALLTKHNNKTASINGTTQVRAGAQRPEIIIPLESSQTAVEGNKLQSLEIGSEVRMIRYPYFGRKGRILDLPSELTQIETGAMVRVAKVQLDDQSEVLIPRANLEL